MAAWEGRTDIAAVFLLILLVSFTVCNFIAMPHRITAPSGCRFLILSDKSYQPNKVDNYASVKNEPLL